MLHFSLLQSYSSQHSYRLTLTSTIYLHQPGQNSCFSGLLFAYCASRKEDHSWIWPVYGRSCLSGSSRWLLSPDSGGIVQHFYSDGWPLSLCFSIRLFVRTHNLAVHSLSRLAKDAPLHNGCQLDSQFYSNHSLSYHKWVRLRQPTLAALCIFRVMEFRCFVVQSFFCPVD